MHRPMLLLSRAGRPMIFTLRAEVVHCTVRQGWGVGGTVGSELGQPATMKISPRHATGWPITFTRMFVEDTLTAEP